MGRAGFALATLYFARARIAIWMRDHASFEADSARLAACYDPAQFPAVGTLIAQLAEEGSQGGLISHEIAELRRSSIRSPAVESEYDAIQSRVAECADRSDRARCALTLLLSHTLSCAGYLFGRADDGTVLLLGSLPDGSPESELTRWADAVASASVEALGSEQTTAITSVTGTGDADSAVPKEYVDGEGRAFAPVLLVDDTSASPCLAAILVYQVEPGRQVTPSRQLCSRLAASLRGYGDTHGWLSNSATARSTPA